MFKRNQCEVPENKVLAFGKAANMYILISYLLNLHKYCILTGLTFLYELSYKEQN